jgi:molecular chaperone DnaK (HSP70)
MSKWAIDLGTTNTCISRWNDKSDQPEIIHLDSICRKTVIGLEKLELPSIIPSSVYLTPSDNLMSKIGLLPFFRKNFFIGSYCQIGMQAIEKQMNQKDNNFIAGFKDHLSANPYDIMTRINKTAYTASQISFYFIRELLHTINDTIKERPRQMVCTVPVDSYETYRYHIKNQFKQLGVNKFSTLDEPVAAAIGYGLNLSGKKHILVFDFGGGTMHTVLVEINYSSMKTGLCRVIAKEGIGLGGNVIDEWILESFFARTGFQIKDMRDNTMISMWYRILRDEACRVKESLYMKPKEKFLIVPPEYFRNLNNEKEFDLAGEFSRDDLITILAKNNLYNIIEQKLDKVLELSKINGISSNDIEDVLIVGGSSLLPKVYNIFEQRFGRQRIRAWQPFEAIAFGASAFSAGRVASSDYISHNYAFITYNKETKKPEYNIIVPEGTRYPTKKDLWKKKLIPSCSLGEPENRFKLVICEIGDKSDSRQFVWDRYGRIQILNTDTEEPLIIPLNESDPTLGYLDPPYLPSDNRPRLEVSFFINEERWLCTTVFDLLTKEILMDETPVIQLQ